MSANDAAPIIIKREKVSGGDGHHGGAWKVAYADFVTAMMAFFLLMWLLNATTETQRKGIADYFSPTIPVNRVSGGGSDAFSGDSVFTEESLAQSGTGASFAAPSAADKANGATGSDPADDGGKAQDDFADLEELIAGHTGESMVSELMQRHIITKVTDEGLIVELHDLPDAPLFFQETDEPTLVMIELLNVLAEVFALVPNEIAINGHTQSRALVVRDNPNWSLSARRALSIRESLIRVGIGEKRVQRVAGFADQKLASKNPMSVLNNRIEVILLRDKR